MQGDEVDMFVTDRNFTTNYGPIDKFYSFTCDSTSNDNYSFVRIDGCGYVDGDELDYPLTF